MKLGRLIEVDVRSRHFLLRNLIRGLPPRSFTWGCDAHLDQGQMSTCVGFATVHQLIAAPAIVQGATSDLAVAIYKRAQDLDSYPGTDYEGTSCIAGMKALLEMFPHAMDSYRWAFTLEDVLSALSYIGPVILGINWYDSMYYPDAEGHIKMEGKLSGGHAILAKGLDISKEQVLLNNSWGESWGRGGDCTLSFADLSTLLAANGEALVAVGQHAFAIL